MEAKEVKLLHFSSSRRFLLAWRESKTLCPLCSVKIEIDQLFSSGGLRQHFRLVHKDTEYNDSFVKDGSRLLRERVALETMKNIQTLSEQREQLVSIHRCRILFFTVSEIYNPCKFSFRETTFIVNLL